MNIWTLAFWKGAGERAVKTAAQSFLAVVGVNVVGVGTGLGFGDIDWTTDLSITGVATVLSLVTSIGNASFTAGAAAQQAAAELTLQRVVGDGDHAESTAGTIAYEDLPPSSTPAPQTAPAFGGALPASAPAAAVASSPASDVTA